MVGWLARDSIRGAPAAGNLGSSTRLRRVESDLTDLPPQMEFDKYRQRGAYHWAQTSRSLRQHNAFVTGRYEVALRAAQPQPGELILDLGCGDGSLTYLLYRNAATTIGLDIDPDGLRLAQRELSKRGSDAPLTLGSGTNLPCASGSFDCVMCSDVLEHVPEAVELIAEISRVLKSGGRLALTTPCRVSEEVGDAHHHKEYYPGELKRLLKQSFERVDEVLSHPIAVADLYALVPQWLGRRPFRFLFNILSILGWNPFLAGGFRHFALIVATAGKGGSGSAPSQ